MQPTINEKQHTHVQGHDFQGNPVKEFRTSPPQLSLFQDAFSPGASSTIELYDAMPKYFASGKEMEALRRRQGGQFLDTLTREFVHRSEPYTLSIRPGRINTKKHGEREFYPTERERLIEQVLRKLAISPPNGIYLGDNMAVQFSLSELRRELERTGHAINYPSLIEGLKINNATQLTLSSKDGTNAITSNIFPMLMLAGRQQWEQDPKNTRCYVKFHPLVTVSVEELTYRQMNYEQFMSLDRSLSRYLFQRMSHLYTQAHWTNPYGIKLSTLVRDSGMTESKHPSDNVKRVERTLDELRDKDVLMRWDKQERRGPHNRILDVAYSLTPSQEFMDDIIRANRKLRHLHR